MMSATTSATTGQRYGLERVCRTWERSRSALYARRARAQCRKRGNGPARRGPTRGSPGYPTGTRHTRHGSRCIPKSSAELGLFSRRQLLVVSGGPKLHRSGGPKLHTC